MNIYHYTLHYVKNFTWTVISSFGTVLAVKNSRESADDWLQGFLCAYKGDPEFRPPRVVQTQKVRAYLVRRAPTEKRSAENRIREDECDVTSCVFTKGLHDRQVWDKKTRAQIAETLYTRMDNQSGVKITVDRDWNAKDVSNAYAKVKSRV